MFQVSSEEVGVSVKEQSIADGRDDYNNYKRLLQNLEYLRVQEEYIKDELHNLKKEYRHAQEEVSWLLVPCACSLAIENIFMVTFCLLYFEII